MNQAFLKVLVSDLVRIATFPFRILPIKKNQILFTGLTGGHNYDYSCNPKYIYEYMRDHFPGQFSYVWAVSDKEKYAFLEEEGVKLVRHFTVSSFPMLLTSRVIVTNGSYAPWFPFRKKQYVINTWHGGGAYKKVENEKPDANWATRKRAEFCANNIDLFVASCKVQEDNMIRKTFQYKGEVLRAGTPRNDKLVTGDIDKMKEKVCNYYKIEKGEIVILYAPTYRNPEKEIVFNADNLCYELGKEGKKYKVLSRYHRYHTNQDRLKVLGKDVIMVANYPDMQELLAAADILITDFSSCIWDYGLLKRPCLLYVPDKEEYIEKTGFYVNMEYWPFPQAKSMEELVNKVKNYNEELINKGIDEHFIRLGSYESGKSCMEITEKIRQLTMED